MAKDPAVLFYTSDFLTGTVLMNFEQRGKYITLLCLQHQKGLLTEKDMLNICQSYDEDVFCKFIKTEHGYYNERMKFEHEKRQNYSQSRSKNRIEGIKNKEVKPKEGKQISYDNHMENENINSIILYLNQKSGKNFKSDSEASKKFIAARLKSYSIEQIKMVVDLKTKEWLGTTMEKYLRPETLFNATKFESYVNELSKKEQMTDDERKLESARKNKYYQDYINGNA